MTHFHLVQTCEACPEQYDAYLDGGKVAFLYLRHGLFFVECPCPGGREVFRARPQGDGIFEWQERDGFIRQALEAVAEHEALVADGVTWDVVEENEARLPSSAQP